MFVWYLSIIEKVKTLVKKIKINDFIQKMLSQGIVKPSEIKAEFERQYPSQKPKSLDCFCKALKRKGWTKEKRAIEAVNVVRKQEGKHILDYEEIAKYKLNARVGHVQASQVDRQCQSLVTMWELMGRTDPHTWTYEGVINAIATKYPFVKVNDVEVFSKKGAVRLLLSAVNTMFPSILPKGWYGNFSRKKGELKDYFTFEEFDLFIAQLTDTQDMSLEGWRALFKAQVNMGCREGVSGRTGIVSLSWENIDYEQKRCSLHEKGGRGDSGRLWKNLPLDLFPWLNGWNDLMLYHVKRFGYEPSNDRHETGKCFQVDYEVYSTMFKETRKKVEGRISGNKETLRPHILRKTHAQWLCKLWVPIEEICGQFPDGYFGVGWDNPQILLGYYITLESERREIVQKTANQRMIKLGVVEGAIEKDAKDLLIEKQGKQIEDLTRQITELIAHLKGVSQ
jgi:hypothetical protein